MEGVGELNFSTPSTAKYRVKSEALTENVTTSASMGLLHTSWAVTDKYGLVMEW